MNLKRAGYWFGCSLLLASTLCVGQQTGDRQQQIAALNQKIKQYLGEKRPDLAIPELQALVALDPDNTDARGNLGVLLFFKGDCSDAVPQLRAATAQHAELWRIQVLLGLCERKLGDSASARSDFESAFPHLDDEKIRLQAGLELIGLYMDNGDIEKAAGVIGVLRAHNPTNVRVLYTAYRLYSQLADEAMLDISLADPGSAEMHEVMARETIRFGDTEKAIAQYRAAIKVDPRLPGIHYELAEALSDSLNPADKAEAENEYKQALAMNPGDVKSECRLGDLDVARNNLQQALTEYSLAVKLSPADIDANLGLAHTMIRLNQNDQARPILEKVVQLEPANETAHYLLSRLLWQEGKKEDAKQELELYKKYKAMKEKLQTVYKQLKVAPPPAHSSEINPGDNPNDK